MHADEQFWLAETPEMLTVMAQILEKWQIQLITKKLLELQEYRAL